MSEPTPEKLNQPVIDLPERSPLRAENARLKADVAALTAQLAEAQRERDKENDTLRAERDAARARCERAEGRLREISDLLADAGVPGGTTIYGGVLTIRERAEKAEAELTAARAEAAWWKPLGEAAEREREQTLTIIDALAALVARVEIDIDTRRCHVRTLRALNHARALLAGSAPTGEGDGR